MSLQPRSRSPSLHASTKLYAQPEHPAFPGLLGPSVKAQLWIAATVSSTSDACIDCNREGFNEVFPLESLGCFFEDEVEAMLCGTGESWTADMLADTIKFDHGCAAALETCSSMLESDWQCLRYYCQERFRDCDRLDD